MDWVKYLLFSYHNFPYFNVMNWSDNSSLQEFAITMFYCIVSSLSWWKFFVFVNFLCLRDQITLIPDHMIFYLPYKKYENMKHYKLFIFNRLLIGWARAVQKLVWTMLNSLWYCYDWTVWLLSGGTSVVKLVMVFH